MNERIRLLAEQANDYANHLDKIGVDEGWQNIFNQKFAQLIVKECADLVDTLNEAYDAPSTAGKFIKTHFGIEA